MRPNLSGRAGGIHLVGQVSKTEERAYNFARIPITQGVDISKECGHAGIAFIRIEQFGTDDAEGITAKHLPVHVTASEGEGNMVDPVRPAHFAHRSAHPAQDLTDQFLRRFVCGEFGKRPGSLVDAHPAADELFYPMVRGGPTKESHNTVVVGRTSGELGGNSGDIGDMPRSFAPRIRGSGPSLARG